MIISAFSWASGVSWVLGITLTTEPSVAQISDEDGVRAVPFEKIGETVYIETVSKYNTFKILFDTENRGIKFGGDDSEKYGLPGAIKMSAIRSPGDEGSVMYLPLCDTSTLSVDYYKLNDISSGEPLKVQGASSSTPWRPVYRFQWPWSDVNYVDGVMTFTLMVNEGDSNFFLSENGEWEKLSNIDYRVVVSGVNRSNSNFFAGRIFPDNFYGKKYFADFGAGW